MSTFQIRADFLLHNRFGSAETTCPTRTRFLKSFFTHTHISFIQLKCFDLCEGDGFFLNLTQGAAGLLLVIPGEAHCKPAGLWKSYKGGRTGMAPPPPPLLLAGLRVDDDEGRVP